jgi:hypothetical protein
MTTTRRGILRPVEFWGRRAREHNELSHLARFLRSAMVQSASCERIFKTWMLFYIRFRNRLLAHKIQGMNRVQSRKRRKESGRTLTEQHTVKSKNRFVSPEKRKTVLEKRLTTVDTIDVYLDDDEQDGDTDVEMLDYENEDDNSDDASKEDDVLTEWKQTMAYVQEDEDEGDAFEEDPKEEAKKVEDTHSMLPM